MEAKELYKVLIPQKGHTYSQVSREGKPTKHGRVFSSKHLQKLVRNQANKTDLYMSKYSKSQLVYQIILDFDNEENIEKAYNECLKLKNCLKERHINTVIVRSGNKGYHIYIQISALSFKLLDNPDTVFRYFVDELIQPDRLGLTCLDDVNESAGLKGNIRVIGSTHPKTGEQCRIIKGEFLTDNEYMEAALPYTHECFERAIARYKANKDRKTKKVDNHKLDKSFNSTSYNSDPIQENDLKKLMPEIYGGEVKEFSDYIMMCCPFHGDTHPSMVVKKEFYYCKTCNEKGNWWTLRDKGVVDFKEEETIRVGK